MRLGVPRSTAIHYLRNHALGETQTEMARRFGTTQSVICEAEKGSPSKELALAIWNRHAELLEPAGFSLLDLLTGQKRRWRLR